MRAQRRQFASNHLPETTHLQCSRSQRLRRVVRGEGDRASLALNRVIRMTHVIIYDKALGREHDSEALILLQQLGD